VSGTLVRKTINIINIIIIRGTKERCKKHAQKGRVISLLDVSLVLEMTRPPKTCFEETRAGVNCVTAMKKETFLLTATQMLTWSSSVCLTGSSYLQMSKHTPQSTS